MVYNVTVSNILEFGPWFCWVTWKLWTFVQLWASQMKTVFHSTLLYHTHAGTCLKLIFSLIPGCSFHSEHFMKNTIAPSFCYEVVCIYFWSAINQRLIYNCYFIHFFNILTIFGQKRQIRWCTLKIWARIHADFQFLRFLVLFYFRA